MTQVVPIPSSVPVSHDWDEAYRSYHANVYRAAYQVTGNAADAEDVMQTVFLRLWRRTPESAGVENLRSYLYRAAINASLDLLRARQEERKALPLDEIDLPDGTSGADETIMLRSWLRSALAKLNPKHAEMFALRYLQELDNREIAKIVGTSHAVVAITLFRIRKQLQNDFKSSQARTGK